MKKIILLVLVFLLFSTAVVVGFVRPAVAEGTIYIKSDGSVEGTDKIHRNGDVYTLMGNIFGELVVERDNIVLDGAGYSIQAPFRGIVLSNRSNVTIKNVKIKTELDRYGYAFGIVLTASCSNTILNNEIIVPYNPIGEASVITGIFLSKSSNNNIISNNTTTATKDEGLILSASSGNTIINNKFNNCGISAHNSVQNAVINNTLNDKPIVYLEGASDYIVEDAGQVILVNCNNITVSNLVLPIIGIQLLNTKNSQITNNEAAISLWESPRNVISENKGVIQIYESEYNNISRNTWWIDLSKSSNHIIFGNKGGIKVTFSANVSIVGNELDHGISLQDTVNVLIHSNNIIGNGNGEGISLSHSFNTTIINNTIANQDFGFYLRYTANNTIYGNNIVGNNVQVANLGSANTWDDGSRGNYWSDYTSRYPNATEVNGLGIWDTPYEIPDAYGISAGDQDRYPLMYYWVPPLISIVSPENKTYSVNNVSLTFTVSEPTSWIGYSLDGQAIVKIAGNTTLTWLSDGMHSLVVYAKDTAGNTGTSETVYFSIRTQQPEPFPITWIVAVTAIIAVVGAALLIYFRKIKKTTEKGE